jgi:hypothetical protein
MSALCDGGTNWDKLPPEEFERYLIRYEFFEEWLRSDARKSGITLDEYDEVHRSKFIDLVSEEDLFPENGCDTGLCGEGACAEDPYGTGEFYHPDDDED